MYSFERESAGPRLSRTRGYPRRRDSIYTMKMQVMFSYMSVAAKHCLSRISQLSTSSSQICLHFWCPYQTTLKETWRFDRSSITCITYSCIIHHISFQLIEPRERSIVDKDPSFLPLACVTSVWDDALHSCERSLCWWTRQRWNHLFIPQRHTDKETSKMCTHRWNEVKICFTVIIPLRPVALLKCIGMSSLKSNPRWKCKKITKLDIPKDAGLPLPAVSMMYTTWCIATLHQYKLFSSGNTWTI
jgi:hypothetical protein